MFRYQNLDRIKRELAPSRRWEYRLINTVRAFGYWLYCKADDQRVKRDPDYIPF